GTLPQVRTQLAGLFIRTKGGRQQADAKWFRKTFLTSAWFVVACRWRAAMTSVQLTSAQRRQLQGRLREADDASYYRRLLALLALDEGDSVAEVAERLGVTRQSVYNWARLYEAEGTAAALQDRYGRGRPSVWTEEREALQ